MEILNVTGSVLQYLRDKIITGELKSGQKLNENALSSSLSIYFKEPYRALLSEE